MPLLEVLVNCLLGLMCNPVPLPVTLHGSQATVSITCAGCDKLDVLLAKKSHHSWSQCLFCPDLTTVIHCWPAYHLLLSNLYKEFRTQLFVWYLTLVFVIM